MTILSATLAEYQRPCGIFKLLVTGELTRPVSNFLQVQPSTANGTLYTRLTSLTAVNHLLSLQYLDISRNQIDSVNG
jgi:hypothetical protein